MHLGRLFTTIGLGAALVQATPIQDQISKATAATPRSASPDQPAKHFHEAE